MNLLLTIKLHQLSLYLKLSLYTYYSIRILNFDLHTLFAETYMKSDYLIKIVRIFLS